MFGSGEGKAPAEPNSSSGILPKVGSGEGKAPAEPKSSYQGRSETEIRRRRKGEYSC